MRYFTDGHSRIYVDDDTSCVVHHDRRDAPIYHVMKHAANMKPLVYTIRCPKSLSPQERSRLKEKP